MPPHTIAYRRVVHLSHLIDVDMPQWPGDPPLELATVAERATHGYFARRLTIGEHGATHLNAPSSFHAGGDGIDAYQAAELVVPAVVFDVRTAASADADFLAAASDLTAWERVHGTVPDGSVVLLHTGWASRWADAAGFLNADADEVLHFPGFSPGLARVLIEERRVAGIGIDTHGVDGGRDQRFAVNALVLERRRLVLENLANLGSAACDGRDAGDRPVASTRWVRVTGCGAGVRAVARPERLRGRGTRAARPGGGSRYFFALITCISVNSSYPHLPFS